MKPSVKSLLTLGVFVAHSALVSSALAASASGNWIWVSNGRSATVPKENILSLQASGSTLTGKISAPGTDGKPADTAITAGKVNGDEISFALIREVNGSPVTNLYSGKIAGDTLTGTISFNRNGETQSRKWEAKNAGSRTEAAAVAPPKPGYDENGNKIVNETHYKEVTVDEAAKILADHPETVVLDLRPPSNFTAGHIPGAKNVDLSDKETYLENLKPLDKTKRYLVYSVVGHFRTVRALEYFEANGFPVAAAIDGGFKAWSTAGKPVEK